MLPYNLMRLKIMNKLKREGLLSLISAIIKYPFTFKKRRDYKLMLEKENLSDRFNEIYKKNLWSSLESLSGDGSEIASTKSFRTWLINNLPKLGVRNVVDASCGDFNWMRYVINKLEIKYVGLDIVPSVIDKNNKLYASNTTKFAVSNICVNKIQSCDLIIVRDCLFHLSFEDINNFLKNIKMTNYRYLLTTTHIVDDGFKNTDITSGDFRIINIFDYPFDFHKKSAKEHIMDSSNKDNIKKEMILFEKKDVPTRLSNF
jgi:hypothetical protein